MKAGDVLGTRTFTVTRADLVAYADASGDHNPIHQDEDFARSVGLPAVIAHGMWTLGAAGSVVSEWAGGADRVVEFGTRFTKPVVVPVTGADVVIRGTVKSVDTESRRAVVEVTVTAGGDKVLGSCVATVQLD